MMIGQRPGMLLTSPVAVARTPGIPVRKRTATSQRRTATIVPRARPTERAENVAQAQVAAAAHPEDVQREFFMDGFLRSFLLGLGIGGLFEVSHVLIKLFGTFQQVGLASLPDAVQGNVEQFAPLFVQDHVAAIASWLLLYGAEVYAIIKIAERYPNNQAAALRALGSMATLPRRMLPVRLQVFKHLMMKPLSAATATARGGRSASGKGASATTTAAAAGPASPLRFVDAPATGTERPTYPRTLPVPRPAAGGPAALPAPPQQQRRRQETLSPGPGAPPVEEGKEETDPEGSIRDDLATRRRQRRLRPGQLDDGGHAGRWAKREKELAGRRMFLKDFWYAAALSKDVKIGEPHGVEMLGLKLVLMRDEATGEVRCISDVCPHRGAPLSDGWMQQKDGATCVTCPYHGWAIDGDGMLRDVPAAERRGEWPTTKPVVASYPVEERGGFVWMFYGSPNMPSELRPPIPYVPELDDPQWKTVTGEIEFDCPHWGVFENAIDMAHIHYLHNDTFGNQDKPEIRNMHVEPGTWGVSSTFELQNKPVSPLWAWTQVPSVQVTAMAMLPSTSVISFTLGNGLSFTTFVNTVPVDGGKAVNRFALVRNLGWDAANGLFNMDAWDKWAEQAMMQILSEDKAMVETLRPDLLEGEISVKADMLQTAFRKLRQGFIDVGYGVLPEETKEVFRGDM